jgi:type II secretory pathway pseudopilin PulG
MTLVEVLFTMGIMALGMVGVASIFPVAAKLQDDASSEIQAEQAARNAEAMIKARGMRVSQLAGNDTQWNNQTGAAANTPDNSPFQWTAAPMTGGAAPAFALRDRAYPSSLYTASLSQCDFFWVPLVRDADPRLCRSEPQAAVFIMRRAAAAPSVTPPGTVVDTADATNGVPVSEVATNTSISLATSTTSGGMQVGDLALYGPVPMAVLPFQWTYTNNTPTFNSTPDAEVKRTDPLANSSPTATNREDPDFYTGGLFSSTAPYAQVFSGTRAVTYRVVLVSGDLFLEK